jgi:hypothetical protein
MDASGEGVGFSDAEIYEELRKEHRDRGIRVYQALCPRSLEAFEIWKEADNPRY